MHFPYKQLNFGYYLMTDLQLSKVEEIPLANYRMDIRYDGQNYFGWQRHKSKPTIQGALEDAVTKCFGLRCNVEGSGRTDRGTHATGQVATVRLPADIDENGIAKLNSALDKSIEITKLCSVADDFHARESAVGKCYQYKIWNDHDMPPELDGKVWYVPESLDVDAMREACPLFVGTLDYASFSKVPNYKRASTVRTVYSLDLTVDGPDLCFSIIADGFLYKMVRNIIRSLVKVGEWSINVEDIPTIIEAKNRKAAPGTAPASGLCLKSVFYDKNSMNTAIKNIREGKN